MAHAINEPYTSPRKMRDMIGIIVARHPLINSIQTTIVAKALKIGGIFPPFFMLEFCPIL